MTRHEGSPQTGADGSTRTSRTVPYITSWTQERTTAKPNVVRHPRFGIGYADESPLDRDEKGVLWARSPLKAGAGKPEFGRVHSARQRRVMRRLLCQICAAPADRTDEGVLWLLHDDRTDWPNWPENMAATHPPVCLPCAEKSIRLCPHLRDNHVAVRVGSPRIDGVYGALYRPSFYFPQPVSDAIVSYDDPGIGWVVASQLVMALNDCTFVDLAHEFATRLEPSG